MKNENLLYVIGSVVLMVAGFIFIPPLMKKYTNKAYKKSCSSEEIDFDNLGPEIVKKSKDEEEE